MNRFYLLALGILGVWRITYFLHAEDGPWDLMARLRERLGTGAPGKLLDCFYCLSLWIAAPLAYWIGQSVPERILLWLALSAGAILLERATREPESPPARYFEDPEDDDGMLRR